MRRHHGADDLGVRTLEWPRHDADADRRVVGLARGDLERVAGQVDVVGRLALPDFQNHINGMAEELGAVQIEHPQRLEVGRQRAGADAENEAALGQVVEHRRLRGQQRGVRLRKVAGAGGQLDGLGGVDQRGQEHHRVGDVLGRVGQVFADEHIVQAQAVGQDDGLAVFAQRLHGVPPEGMHRHHEHSESHPATLLSWPNVEKQVFQYTQRYSPLSRDYPKASRTPPSSPGRAVCTVLLVEFPACMA